MFLRVMEFFVFLVAAAFFVTEIVVPLVRGTGLFPTFKRTGKLHGELANEVQKQSDSRLADVIERVKKGDL